MSAKYEPQVDSWYQAPNGQAFSVVAIDEAGETVEIQFAHGGVGQIGLDQWYRLSPEPLYALGYESALPHYVLDDDDSPGGQSHLAGLDDFEY